LSYLAMGSFRIGNISSQWYCHIWYWHNR